MAVTIDPTAPPGTQLLSLGDDRIREINSNLAVMFGGVPPTPISFGAPFSFFDAASQALGRLSVVAPVNDTEIARLGDVNEKVVVSADLTTTNQINYSGSASPAITAYNAGSLYLVTNTGLANGALGVTIQLGTAPTVLLLHVDGTPLQAGDLFAGQIALLAYSALDQTLRLINFVGGVLSAEPTLAQSATTKQYVDGTVQHPTVASMTGNVTLTQNVVTTVLTTSITVPTGNWLLHVDYGIFAQFNSFGLGNQMWVSDGTQKWALSAQNGYPSSPTILIKPPFTAAGISPVVYPAGAVTLTLQALMGESGATALQTNPLSGALVTTSYMTVTLMRTV